MLGSGKTALVTKFAREFKDCFDYVVWFSLLETPSLKTLLIRYIKVLDRKYAKEQKLASWELSSLLAKFIECLKQRRVLLIVDGLQSILRVNEANTSYKKEWEEYGQLLRSVISSNHRSVLLATSRIKPKLLEYYSKSQVKFLDLKGFDYQTTKNFLTSQEQKHPQETKISCLLDVLRGNPQLLKIIHNHLEDFTDDPEQIVQDISLLEEVQNILEIELSYASSLEKEIIYWLAVNCSGMSLRQLSQYSSQSQRKLEFLQSINSLVKRTLINETNNHYFLMPLMKVYLKRKLVQQALTNHPLGNAN
jgi:hypothetical protein